MAPTVYFQQALHIGHQIICLIIFLLQQSDDIFGRTSMSLNGVSVMYRVVSRMNHDSRVGMHESL